MLRTASLPLLLVTLLCAGAVRAASAASWSYSAGGGVISGYDSGSGEFGSTGLGWLAVQKNVNPTLGLRSELGYLGYVVPSYGYSIYNDATASYVYVVEQHVRGDLVPLALGFRWSSPFGGSGVGVYLDFMPTLTFARWKGHGVFTEWQDTVSVQRREEGSFARLVPGLAAGIGLRFQASDQWQIHYGVRHLSTATMGAALYSNGSEYPGLRGFSLAAALSWAPVESP